MGLSGGSDSTLALLVAVRMRSYNSAFEVLAVHCIRGLDASDPIWLEHCTRLCERLDVPLVTPKLNIVYGGGISPEDSSRKERYAALLANLKDNGYLLLGHQADDQVENFLLALKRGSGPYGLSGMRQIIKDERGTILRPLLSINKKTIEQIIEALGFNFVFDESNEYLKFERNFIRLKVLPLMRKRFAGVDRAILRSSYLCALEHDLAMRYAKDKAVSCICDNTLSIDALPLEDKALATCIMRLFIEQYAKMPPDLNIIEDALKLCAISNDQEALIVIEKDLYLRRYLKKLYITKDYIMPDPGIYTLKAGDELHLGSFVYKLCVLSDAMAECEDSECLVAYDSVDLDFTYTGKTRLKPLKRVHSREMKKLFGEYEVPHFMRKSHPVVMHNGIALGLGSLFTCHRDNYRYYLKISCDNELVKRSCL